MAVKIAIIDLGMGNLYSVRKALHKHAVFVSADPHEISKADKLILPGVGHFGKAMQALHQNNLLNTLNEAVLVTKKPILGICLGMQLMGTHSAEGNSTGLSWFDSEIVRFESTPLLKVPHMGWNTLAPQKESLLLKKIAPDSEFYFAHSYYWKNSYSVETLTVSNYTLSFSSAVERDNIFGVQFHPEKSHQPGLRLLENFAAA
jgi:glutamine amidotransferase